MLGAFVLAKPNLLAYAMYLFYVSTRWERDLTKREKCVSFGAYFRTIPHVGFQALDEILVNRFLMEGGRIFPHQLC